MRIFELFEKPIKECTTSGAIAVAIPNGGNGFKSGGPGTISRTGSKKKKSKQ